MELIDALEVVMMLTTLILKFVYQIMLKNISVKFLDLISKKSILKNISFHKTCKCGCLLDEKVCNNLQKWNKYKCRCKCLKIKMKSVSENKTITLIKKVKNCKPFISVSTFFLYVSVILTGIMIYFYIKSINNNVFILLTCFLLQYQYFNFLKNKKDLVIKSINNLS